MENRAVVAASANYFVFFACMGSFMPFMNLFLHNAGWSGTEIGLYASIGPILAIVTQPLWGLVSDYLGDTKRVYSLLLALSGMVTLIFGFLPVSGVFFALAILTGTLQSPLSPMLDSLALGALPPGGSELGIMRLWGSLSFALITLLMGSVFEWYDRSIFFAYALTVVAALAAVRFLPQREPVDLKQRASLSMASLRKATNPLLLMFLAALFLYQLAHNPTLNFLSIILSDRGGSSALVGYSWSIPAFIEIPVFFLLSRAMNRFSPGKILWFGAFLGTIRMFLLYFAQTAQLTLIIHLIDGISFPLLLVPAVLIVDELVPKHLRTTGQTLYATIAQTVPRILGGLLGGRIYDIFGGSTIYLVSGSLAVLASILIFVIQLKLNVPNPLESGQIKKTA